MYNKTSVILKHKLLILKNGFVTILCLLDALRCQKRETFKMNSKINSVLETKIIFEGKILRIAILTTNFFETLYFKKASFETIEFF